MHIVLASRNPGKLAELQKFLADLPLTLSSAADHPSVTEVIEDGDSFEANALKKARQVCTQSGHWALADDSGLEVDALHGAPGIYSARYAGPQANDENNNLRLLENLASVPPEKRQARFVCCLALVSPEGETWITHGICPGIILSSPQGTNGFGYDPLFLYEPLQLSFAELTTAEKSLYSHRGRALAELKSYLQGLG